MGNNVIDFNIFEKFINTTSEITTVIHNSVYPANTSKLN